MTEGIIQQVFGRFVVLETPYLTRDEILELRDELIKKIKTLHEEYGHDEYLEIPLKELIGENKK